MSGEALHLSARHHLHLYDALIVAAAIEVEFEILYSEDVRQGQRFGNLRVENPFV